MVEVKFFGKLEDVIFECRQFLKSVDKTVTEPAPELPRIEQRVEMPTAQEPQLGNSGPLKGGDRDCRFCGKSFERVLRHEPHCEKNPNGQPSPLKGKPIRTWLKPQPEQITTASVASNVLPGLPIGNTK